MKGGQLAQTHPSEERASGVHPVVPAISISQDFFPELRNAQARPRPWVRTDCMNTAQPLRPHGQRSSLPLPTPEHCRSRASNQQSSQACAEPRRLGILQGTDPFPSPGLVAAANQEERQLELRVQEEKMHT